MATPQHVLSLAASPPPIARPRPHVSPLPSPPHKEPFSKDPRPCPVPRRPPSRPPETRRQHPSLFSPSHLKAHALSSPSSLPFPATQPRHPLPPSPCPSYPGLCPRHKPLVHQTFHSKACRSSARRQAWRITAWGTRLHTVLCHAQSKGTMRGLARSSFAHRATILLLWTIVSSLHRVPCFISQPRTTVHCLLSTLLSLRTFLVQSLPAFLRSIYIHALPLLSATPVNSAIHTLRSKAAFRVHALLYVIVLRLPSLGSTVNYHDVISASGVSEQTRIRGAARSDENPYGGGEYVPDCVNRIYPINMDRILYSSKRATLGYGYRSRRAFVS